jgi:hypothetical protein
MRLLGANGTGWLPRLRYWLESHRRQPRPGCPKNLLEEAMETPNGVLVRRCFRILNAKAMGLTIMLADITEEEFRVLELIDTERQEQISAEDNNAKSFQELLVRKLSRR